MGGELLVEVLSHLDLEALRSAEPTWVVGYSDTSALLLPPTAVAGWATLHGSNLLETPCAVPPLVHRLDVATLPSGGRVEQEASHAHRSDGVDPWQHDRARPVAAAPGRRVRRRARRAGRADDGPDSDGFTQLDAVRSVLGDLDVPVVLDVDCGTCRRASRWWTAHSPSSTSTATRSGSPGRCPDPTGQRP